MERNPQLTRYLYFRDECFYSLLFSLIQKTSFEEVVFWAEEIYYSGFHNLLWEHVWKMYYDFYAIKYPKYEKKINKLSKEKMEFKNIVYVLNLFYYSKPLTTVFAFRIINPQSPTHVYMGRMPKWLKRLDLAKSERRLIRSIHHGKKINVAFYLNQSPDKQKSYDAIKKYFTQVKGVTLKNKSLNKINYKNKSHILLSFVCHMSLDVSEIQTRTVYKKLDETILAKQGQINDIEPLYKTLSCKRLYKISPLVGVFKLERFNIENMDYKDVLRLHWDYFAYNTPLWNERIKNCNGTLNDEKFELLFKNDNDNEEFYEKYNYEPDEESQETQEKSICKINMEEGNKWLTDINNDMGIKKGSFQQIY